MGIVLSVSLAEKTTHDAIAAAKLQATEVAVAKAAPVVVTTASVPASVPAEASQTVFEPVPADLGGMSYVVLTFMVALICIGLGWCFFRAMRAAAQGTDLEEQVAEDVS